jgi:lipoprotein-anchoring transpeptidase ErfK/SrfK
MCTITLMSRNQIGVKSVWHYLKVYFVSVFLSLAIVTVGFFLEDKFDCANSATCKSDLAVRVDNDIDGFFQGHKVVPPKVDLAMSSSKSPVLGVRVSNGEKHIYVDLSTQTVYAYEGNAQIMKFVISSGKWGRTPVGNFNVWQKLPVTRMAGGEGADAYDLPNIQWVMYFHNDFGFHTAYWHDNFGHPMSHGCVNMRLIDAKQLYDWADGPVAKKLGTAVSVCNQFEGPNTCKQN